MIRFNMFTLDFETALWPGEIFARQEQLSAVKVGRTGESLETLKGSLFFAERLVYRLT